MIWSYFVVFAIISVLLWAVGAWASWRNRRSLAFITTGLGLCVFFSYILIMWITLERPPLRTMGETRLWYSFFLPLAGMIVYSRWQYKWILSFSTLLATVFVCVSLQTGDTFKDPHACFAESMVCPSRHRLHDGLCPLGCSCGHVGVSALLQERHRYHKRDGDYG